MENAELDEAEQLAKYSSEAADNASKSAETLHENIAVIREKLAF